MLETEFLFNRVHELRLTNCVVVPRADLQYAVAPDAINSRYVRHLELLWLDPRARVK